MKMTCAHEHMNMPDEKSFSTGVYSDICYSMLKLVYYGQNSKRFEFIVDDGKQDVKFTKDYDRSSLTSNEVSGFSTSVIFPATKIDGEVCLKYTRQAWLPFYTTNIMEARRRIHDDLMRWAAWLYEQMKSKKSVKRLRTMSESKLRNLKMRISIFDNKDGKEVLAHSFTTTIAEIRCLACVIAGKHEAYSDDEVLAVKGQQMNPMELMKETLRREKLKALVEELKERREKLRTVGKDYYAVCNLKLKKFFNDTFPELSDYQVEKEMNSFGFFI